MKNIQLTTPDDWHHHLRDGEFLATTVPAAAKQFNRVIVMPNLKPAVSDIQSAEAYYHRILAHSPKDSDFTPLMTLYLHDEMGLDTIKAAAECPFIAAAKLYPKGATTNSQNGVTNIDYIFAVLDLMQTLNMPLLIHGEVTDDDIDIFDREEVFIDKTLTKIINNFPNLPIVLEHITTKNAVDFVLSSQHNIAATITPHHLLYNRNQLLAGAIRPHYYCLPILKRNSHQQALIKAATSGSNKFFAGTDSAPHTKDNKHCAAGCAGIYNACCAIESYAHVFEEQQAIDKLEGFLSHYGADFYGLDRNKTKITLQQQPWKMPEQLEFGNNTVIPMQAGEILRWQISN